MSIQPIDREFGGEEMKQDLKNGKLHVVCIAANGATVLNACAVVDVEEDTKNGITDEQATNFCVRINERNEACTLYPKLNVTILPLTKYKHRDNWNQEENMKRIIKDAFIANVHLMQKKEMVFAFDSHQEFNSELAIKVLEQIAQDYLRGQILEKVYFVYG